MRIELLSEHSKKNDQGFFHLLDDMQEDWKERLDNLKSKGRRQKLILKD